MFGKLMKYELRYLIRVFGPMWAIVVSLCVLTRLTLKPNMDGMMYVEGTEAIVPAIIVMLTIFAIVTMMIVAMVVLIQRFYKGMYGDEGYLMFTLPVTTGCLIHSKALSAFLMMVTTMLVTYVGILIMISYPHLWFDSDALGMTLPQLWDLFMDVMEANGMTAPKLVIIAFWAVLVSLLTVAQGIYLLYLAISIGQLWKKHPVAGAIIAYYIITLIINALIGGFGMTNPGNLLESIAGNMEYGAALTTLMIATTVYNLILIVISFIGTKLILDKKLNIA